MRSLLASCPRERPTPPRWPALCLLCWLCLSLGACGGGGGGGGSGGGAVDAGSGPGADEPAPVVIEEPTGPGRTLSVEQLARIPAAEVQQALAAMGAQAPRLAAAYDVVTWRIVYLTRDAEGREQAASGLMAVPAKPARALSPVLSWQHGTLFRDADAPSNALRASEWPIIFAAAGHFVVAADYVGYGFSKGVPHPYLLSAPSASAVLDMLVAARNWRLRNRVATNGQLFLAGYSEGGYTTMAAHRALEAAASATAGGASGTNPNPSPNPLWAGLASELVAAVPGAGPTHVAATLDALLEQIRDENALLGALIDPGFLRHLGSKVRAEVRRALMREIVPGDTDVAFDTRFIDAFLEDDRSLIARQSDVHDWKPVAPVHLFHGRDDRTVPYASSSSTLAAMRARGAQAVSLTDCAAAPSGHLECVPAFVGFLADVLNASARDR